LSPAAEFGGLGVQADVSKPADVQRTYRDVFKAFGHLDAAVRGAANGTAYYGSKFALRGMTECWRAELRPHNVRVILINASEVITNFAATAGFPQSGDNPTKLQGDDIAGVVKAALEMDDRGFIPELTVFAANPKD